MYTITKTERLAVAMEYQWVSFLFFFMDLYFEFFAFALGWFALEGFGFCTLFCAFISISQLFRYPIS